MVKESASRAADLGSIPALGRVIPVTEEVALQWLPYQAPGDIGSVLGLVSVYRDWVRQIG